MAEVPDTLGDESSLAKRPANHHWLCRLPLPLCPVPSAALRLVPKQDFHLLLSFFMFCLCHIHKTISKVNVMMASCFPLEIFQEQQFWTNVVYTYNRILFGLTRMEIQQYTTTLKNPEGIRLSEDSKLQRGQCCMESFCEVSKNRVHGVKGKDKVKRGSAGGRWGLSNQQP